MVQRPWRQRIEQQPGVPIVVSQGVVDDPDADPELVIAVGIPYIRLIRRYRLTSGTTLPAMMAAPSPTATAASNRIFTCHVSPLVPITETLDLHLSRNTA